MAAVFYRAGEGEALFGGRIVIKAALEQLTITESWFDAARPGAATHLHRHHVDSFYVLEGELGVTIDPDPTRRTVCGISSGGIAAFTAAWHFPDQCRRVLSHCGSFTDIWGGHNFPSLVRRTPRKPLRVFLQSGANDANTPFGDWALANRTMASALEYAGYDYRFEFGTGGHTLAHGGALFAESLRWLWREESGEDEA